MPELTTVSLPNAFRLFWDVHFSSSRDASRMMDRRWRSGEPSQSAESQSKRDGVERQRIEGSGPERDADRH